MNRYLPLSGILALVIGSLVIPSPATLACSCLSLTAEPQYVKADGSSPISLTAEVLWLDATVSGGVNFSVAEGPGSVSPANDSSDPYESVYHQPTQPTPAKVRMRADTTIVVPAEGGGTQEIPLSAGADAYVVKVEVAGTTSLTRAGNANYTVTVLPSGLNPNFNWKFTGGSVTIEEDTGSTATWGGTMVVSGTIEGTAIFEGGEIKDAIGITVSARDWKMATPPAAQEVTAPAWDGIFGLGTEDYQYEDVIQGNPGHVSSGPNKDFYYILSNNYWENWLSFQWWITPGFRTSNGDFWVRTKQEEGYSDQQIANAIQALIGHETDGTGSNTLGHRKIITAKIQGNSTYDPKRAVESLVSYNNPQQLGQGYTLAANTAKQNFENYYKKGEEHPVWGNWSGYVWFTGNQGAWGRVNESW